MVNYYKNKMEEAYSKWQTAVEIKDKFSERRYMNDYLNYKQMYDNCLKVVVNNE